MGVRRTIKQIWRAKKSCEFSSWDLRFLFSIKHNKNKLQYPGCSLYQNVHQVNDFVCPKNPASQGASPAHHSMNEFKDSCQNLSRFFLFGFFFQWRALILINMWILLSFPLLIACSEMLYSFILFINVNKIQLLFCYMGSLSHEQSVSVFLNASSMHRVNHAEVSE